MGRGKHCTPEQRRLIRRLLAEGKTYAEIEETLEISAKMIVNAKNYEEKPETRGRKKVLSTKSVSRIVRCSKASPNMPATEIKKTLKFKHKCGNCKKNIKRKQSQRQKPKKSSTFNKKTY